MALPARKRVVIMLGITLARSSSEFVGAQQSHRSGVWCFCAACLDIEATIWVLLSDGKTVNSTCGISHNETDVLVVCC